LLANKRARPHRYGSLPLIRRPQFHGASAALPLIRRPQFHGASAASPFR
jgi:hypothetical protein